MPVVVLEQRVITFFNKPVGTRRSYVPITHFTRLNCRDFRRLKHFAKFKSREKKGVAKIRDANFSNLYKNLF